MNGELTDVNASVSTIRNLAKLMACVLQQPVLVLNRLWQAVNVCSARRALTLLFEGRAQVVYESPSGSFHTYDFGEWKDFSVEQESGEEDQINTISFKIGIPKVILLLVYDRFPKKEVKFTRHNIFERDRNQCQYCGKILERKLLNLDHVVPRDRGGPTTWENIVCSCIPCNTRKANRTPPEAGMHLIRKPKRPKWRPFVQVNFTLNSHSSWRHFLDIAYWNVEIGEDVS
jgi:5-methylcytosine-specific restriction endonuclease McrA